MTDPQQPASRPVESGVSSSLLGHREREVLAVVRELGSATVQQVAERLSCGLAYTTVMTTLDRLFRKGLLTRKKMSRAYLYSMTLSARDIEGRRATHFVRRFFSESDARPEMLISCLVDAVDHYDSELLNQLESGIRAARSQSTNSIVRRSPAGKDEQ
jgi:predicted transcriptional regulator